jgi:sucrose-phosphate synthase
LRNEDVWETFAQRGRQRVLDRYTWDRTAENYLRVIADVLRAPDARRPEDLLPVHPYFRDAEPEHDVTLQELSALYFPSQ